MTRLEIAQIRQNYGFSYRQIANEINERGLSHTYISLLEKGEKPLTGDLINKILTAIYKADVKRSQGGLKDV